MLKIVRTIGDIVAVFGVLLCLTAGLSRAVNISSMRGLQTLTLFNLGVGLMVFACLAKLHVLTSKT